MKTTSINPRPCVGGPGLAGSGFLLTTDQRVPHISLVFREMWETRISLGSLCTAKNCGLAAVVSHISRKTSEIWGTLWSWSGQNSATMGSLTLSLIPEVCFAPDSQFLRQAVTPCPSSRESHGSLLRVLLLRQIFLAHDHVAFPGGLLSALAIKFLVPRLPCAQAVHIAVVHTECGGDEHRVVNLNVARSGGARF